MMLAHVISRRTCIESRDQPCRESQTSQHQGQGALVQALFGAILIVAVGSLAGQVAGIKGMFGDLWFWIGHQGWEYLELGRLWQILLFVGLLAWLFIPGGDLMPAPSVDCGTDPTADALSCAIGTYDCGP